ncbi:hypothetical protein AJ80_05030 [Polytolypa hystricis UAMH7299]|uniref:NACHT domain-containing protein n=1 Tax=Polytolypa hystricis (strain UAMH7299) TaxID=1447883 RepID=A0A2B7Y5X0_POLH7|nr:hypothetical protein AJ80_05030 [Polytolypa hystricis UAMH7299]
MEALGAAAAILQILELTVKVGSACQTFYVSVRDARRDIKRVIDEMANLSDVLFQLQDVLDSPGASALTSSDLLDRADGPLIICRVELEVLKDKLEVASKRGGLRRLAWPFREKEVTKLVEAIERQKSMLELALTVGNTAVGISTHESVHELRREFADSQSEERRKKILNWLSVTDPSTNYIAARSKHEVGTGDWFLNGSRFEKWKAAPNSVLWLHGKAGCGKSILCSSIIDRIESMCRSDPIRALTYFFFDFNDADKQNSRNAVKSLIAQLCRQRPDIPPALDYLYQKCHEGDQSPTWQDLKDILPICAGSFSHVYIILDALDECATHDSERGRMLELLSEIHSWDRNEIHILVTSRRELDIDEVLVEILTKPTETPVSLQDDMHHRDIRLHISKQLMSSKFKSWPKRIKQEVEEALGQQVDGMFRWVACQLDLLQNLSQASKIRKALKCLPKTLDATYDRMLNSIDDEYRDQAILALQWLAYSARPLTVAELAEATVINPRDDPPFDFEDRLFNPIEILRCLPGLATITSPHWHFTGKNEVKLAHASVKEYLTSSQILEGPAKDFHISRPNAHLLMAETCLSYHLYASKGVLYDANTILDYPLCEYAAQYWAYHAQLIDFTSWGAELDRLCSGVLGERENAFLNLVRVVDPDREEWKTADYGKVLEDLAPQIYYAAASGLTQAVGSLLAMGADVNSTGGRYCNPLNVACRRGNDKVVSQLLTRGADVNKETPFGTALQIATCAGHERVVRLLLDHGATLTGIDRALQVAVDRGFQDLVHLLQDRGAQLPQQTASHEEALLHSVKDNSITAVRDLIEKGANVNVENGTDGTPIQAAAEAGLVDIVAVLLSFGADVNHIGPYYYGTALQGAARYGHIDTVNLLVLHGAEVNASSGEYGSPLQAAARGNHVDIVRLLLEKGADVDFLGGRYGTALAAAARTGQIESVEALLDHGASVEVDGEVKGKGRYRSALTAATEGEYKRAIALLARERSSKTKGAGS